MGKIQEVWLSLEAFLVKWRKHIFFAVSIAVTVVACVYFYCNILTTVLAGLFAVYVFFELQSDNYFKISSCDSKKCNLIVNIGWSLVMFSIYITICSILQFEEDGVMQYLPGALMAIIVCTLVYMFIPGMSYRLHLYDGSYWSYSSILLTFFVLLVLSFITYLCEDYKIDNARWEKVEFVAVQSCDKEVWHENTIYIVTLQDGNIFAVHPDVFPDVRKVAPGSKVRMITSRSSSAGGVPLVKKFEVK